MQHIDLSTWKRAAHFDFFSQFDEPYWGITVAVNVTHALAKVKKEKLSFFSYYLHKAVLSSNAIENLKYRITPENKVVLYENLGASATIMRDDETIGFSYIPYEIDYPKFYESVQKETARIKSSRALFPPTNPENVIHYSALPWLDFSSLSHARNLRNPDSVPKISFGKVTKNNLGEYTMPVSVHVHHGLVDGIHVSRFIDVFQKLLQE